MTDTSVEVIVTDSSNSAQWDSYISSHPRSTVYHTRAWCTVQQEAFGYRSWLLMARDQETGQTIGVLPLYQVSTPFSSRLVSVPFRDRGGPLWSSVAAFKALLHATKKIAEETSAAIVQLKSLDVWPRELLEEQSVNESLHWVHSQIALKDLTEDSLWKSLGSKTRNMIRQAEGHGLELHDATNDAGGLDDWYALHLLTQKRLGVPPFPRIFFSRMISELGQIGAIRLYCVRQGASVLSATLILKFRDTSIYGYSASSFSAQRLRSNDFMLYRVLHGLIGEGAGMFDLGSDAPGQDSLLFFKRKWGARQQKIPTYTFGPGNAVLTDSSSPRYTLARKVFTHLPIPVSLLAGKVLTRYFG